MSHPKHNIDHIDQSEPSKRLQRDDLSTFCSNNQSTAHKPIIIPIPSLFPYSFMSSLVTGYLDDHDVILGLLLVNKAIKPHLTAVGVAGYRWKSPVRQDLYFELIKPDRYLQICPTQLGDVVSLLMIRSFSLITSIKLAHRYDVVIEPNMLPQSVTELHLGYCFNQPIARNVLPAQLKKLTLSYLFDHAIEPGVLPDSLESLHLGRHFNRPLVAKSLPDSLTYLHLGDMFNHPLQSDILPSKLTTLILSN